LWDIWRDRLDRGGNGPSRRSSRCLVDTFRSLKDRLHSDLSPIDKPLGTVRDRRGCGVSILGDTVDSLGKCIEYSGKCRGDTGCGKGSRRGNRKAHKGFSVGGRGVGRGSSC
jgi:hypothetical protein